MRQGTFKNLLISIVTGTFLLISPRARADATVDWDSDNGFDPRIAVIGPDQNVTWWNVDIYGYDLDVLFNSGYRFTVPNFQGVQVTFPATPGVYDYHDDDGMGFTGTVIVNVAPTVSITAPTNNAVFLTPASFELVATASDTADDSISDVQFFLDDGTGAVAIDDVFSTPYSTTVTNLAAGNYTLSSVATDSHGWTGSASITVTVTASAAVALMSPRPAAGEFLFDVAGLTAGKTNLVQVSTNLTSWSPVSTNVAASATMTVTNSAIPACQFYRVVQLP